MNKQAILFTALIFFGFAMALSFQNCGTTSMMNKEPVAINNKASKSKIKILDAQGSEKNNFKTGDKANFVFQNVFAICVEEPEKELPCVNNQGLPLQGRFSEIAESGINSNIEKEVDLQFPGKMVIYGFTDDPVYPVISSTIEIKESSGPRPASKN